MFEKEADLAETEMLIHCHGDYSKKKNYREGWQEGATFGYNKANEWHYPSKGELPKEDTDEKETLYLLWGGADDSDYISGVFSHGRFWCFDSGWFEVNEIIAWKEIVLPEEAKMKMSKSKNKGNYRNIPLVKMAEKLGITEGFLSRIEKGTRTFSVSLYEKMRQYGYADSFLNKCVKVSDDRMIKEIKEND